MVKGFVVAGTCSGCGKTTVALGVLRALKNRKINVQPFKAGPDFIDSGLHRMACGKASINLDMWSMNIDYWFLKYATVADFNVIEGVMGLFDGDFSTFNLSKKLKLPIILVVDTYGMAESIEALIQGYKALTEKDGLSIYIVLNRVSSENHLLRMLRALKGKAEVIGYLMKQDFHIPSRHLGLFTAEENPITDEIFDTLAYEIEKNFDMERILKLRSEYKLEYKQSNSINIFKDCSSIAIAYDKAFCFYYTHIIDSLKEAGCKISFFSPLKDSKIPDHTDLIWIGGGYPELYATELSENQSMKNEIKKWINENKKLYAECGGLIYLCKTLIINTKQYEMIDIFPFEINMNKMCLGYREVLLNENAIIGLKGMRFRGHEFHYSKILNDKWKDRLYTVKDNQARTWQEGYRFRNCLATYVHFISNINS
ncbi:cobyrinate a,c-diamide synthase [Thermodesulfovibrio thiophilus]|uniref:cobyrinate a,c-diamide synthase n=1 Tax=Thermodesulfovibrio thiophilus TaxID=340095 RepID=UPI00040FA653|nr:cobyrinate a,c-diamide synthase [Thermodesulfovibrio thiophilus]